MEPPLGVKILVVLAGVAGGLMIAAGSVFGAAFLDAFGPGVASLGGLVVVVGLLYLAYAFGLWMLEPWAWWLAVILSGFGAVSALLNLSKAALPFVVNAAILAYLYFKRELFGVQF